EVIRKTNGPLLDRQVAALGEGDADFVRPASRFGKRPFVDEGRVLAPEGALQAAGGLYIEGAVEFVPEGSPIELSGGGVVAIADHGAVVVNGRPRQGAPQQVGGGSDL